MDKLLTLIVSGTVFGALYSVMASGLILTYLTSNIFNLAQGATAFATAYVFYALNTGQGWAVVPSALVAVGVFAPLLGLALDRLMFRRLVNAPISAQLVATVGLVLALPAAVLWISKSLRDGLGWSLPDASFAVSVPGLGPAPRHNWEPIDGVIITSDQVVVCVVAALSAASLWFVVRHTRLGLNMRAVVDRPSLASLRGVDTVRTTAVSWMISTTMAGFAGVALAPIFSLEPRIYDRMLFAAIAAAVLGRLSSIPIAFAGEIAIGIAQNLITGYTPLTDTITGFKISLPFIFLFGFLFLLGRDRTRRAGTTTEWNAVHDDDRDLPPWRHVLPWLVAATIFLTYVAFFADDYWAGLAARGLALSVVLLSFTIVTGLGGMVSLAQASFVTGSAFVAGFLMSRGWSFLAALAAATVFSALLGALIALPTRKLAGLPLALSTLAIALIAENLVFTLDSVAHRDEGWAIRPPTVFGLDFSNPRTFTFGLMAVVVTLCWLVANLTRSATGRAILAVRTAEPGAVAAGISPIRARLQVFIVSAAIAGLGGVLLAASRGRITRGDFPVEIGLLWLASTVTWGVAKSGGAVVAGIVAVMSPTILGWVNASPYLPSVLFGLGAINLSKDPDGLLAMIPRDIRRKRAKRQQASPDKAQEAVEAKAAPVAADDNAILSLRNIRAGYSGLEVLHGVNLDVGRGRVLALLGPNGAGKSTLCGVVSGLVPVEDGRMSFDGTDISSRAAHQRVADGIFACPEARGIFPGLTVHDNLRMWLDTSEDVEASYKRFPVLSERRRQLAGSLSGGEQQMLALAPALARPPALLVVDEPSLGLAPLIVSDIYKALAEAASRGVSVLLVEEHVTDAMLLADDIAFISNGSIVWSGPRSEVDEDRLSSYYLGTDDEPVTVPNLAP